MRRLALLLAATLLAGLPVPHASAYTRAEATITSADGTELHATVFRDDGARGRQPVVLLVSPYLGSSVAPQYAELARLVNRGYTLVQVSLRGFGESAGCSDFGGKGEQADVKAAVEWAAKQSWSTGRVGMWGVSYDAWTQVMALATKPKGLAAAVIQSPLVSLYRGLYMNGAHYSGGWWTTPALYGQQQLSSGEPPAPEEVPCHAANLTETLMPTGDSAYWKERDLVDRAKGSTVPVLWSHGFRDANTKPDNLSALYPLLRGPKRAWVGQFAHQYPTDRNEPEVRERYIREAFDWLDAYVKRDPKALRRVRGQSGAVVQTWDDEWRGDTAWPPKDMKPLATALRSGTYADVVANEGGTGNEAGATLWSISQPLPYDVHLSGVPRVTVSATGEGPAQVVVKVFDIAPEGGAATLVTRGIHAFVSGKVSFDLYPQDWRFARGHRIGVAVLGNDGSYWQERPTGVVTVESPSIALPLLRYDRATDPVLFDEGVEPNPEFHLDDATITANQTTFRLPPKMRRR